VSMLWAATQRQPAVNGALRAGIAAGLADKAPTNDEPRLILGQASSRTSTSRHSPSGSKPVGSGGGSPSPDRLQMGQGIPAPPQLQACGPVHG
jgi:hypothetical protein